MLKKISYFFAMFLNVKKRANTKLIIWSETEGVREKSSLHYFRIKGYDLFLEKGFDLSGAQPLYSPQTRYPLKEKEILRQPI